MKNHEPSFHTGDLVEIRLGSNFAGWTARVLNYSEEEVAVKLLIDPSGKKVDGLIWGYRPNCLSIKTSSRAT